MTLLTCYNACNFVYANKLASHQLLIRQQNAHTKTLKKLAFSKHLSNMTDKKKKKLNICCFNN